MKKCLTIYYYYHHYHLILYFTYNWFSTNLCLFFFLTGWHFSFLWLSRFPFSCIYLPLVNLGMAANKFSCGWYSGKIIDIQFWFIHMNLLLCKHLSQTRSCFVFHWIFPTRVTELSSYIVRGIPVVGIGCCCNQCTLTNFGRFVLCIILCSAIVTHNGPRMFIQFF